MTINVLFDPILGKLRQSDVGVVSLATLIVSDSLIVNNLIVTSNTSLNTLYGNTIYASTVSTNTLISNNISNNSTISTNLLSANGVIASLASYTEIHTQKLFASTATLGLTHISTIDWNLTSGVTLTVEGQMNWDTVNQTVVIGMAGGNVDVALGMEQVFPKRVLNSTGSTMPKGTVVYINGVSGNDPTVARAIATKDMSSAFTLGMTSENIAAGQKGWVTTFGEIAGLNLSAYTGGDTLYLSGVSAGLFTNVPQLAPYHYVRVGTVVKATPDGSLVVNVINGYELDEIHNVAISSLASGQILQSGASNLWYNVNPAFIPTSSYPSLGSLAQLNELSYNALVSKPSLGSLAPLNELSYFALVSKPSLGSLAPKNSLDYSELTGTPSLGSLAQRNTLSYTELTNLPSLGSLAEQNSVNFFNLVSYPSLGSLSKLNSLSYYALDSRLSLGSLAVQNNLSYFSLDSRLSLGSLALVSDVVSPLVLSGATLSISQASIVHSNLGALTTGDDHTQYALLAGRSGGQTLYGGTAASNNIIIRSTSNGTKGNVVLGDNSDTITIGTATPNSLTKTTINGTAPVGGNYNNIFAQLTVSSAGAYLTGQTNKVSSTHTTGTTTSIQGLFNYVDNTSAGNISNVEAFAQRVDNRGSGTIVDASNIKIFSPTNSGTITTLRGIYIENMTGTGIGTGYSIYSNGGEMYHKGTIKVGEGYYHGNSNNPYNIQRTEGVGDILSGATISTFQFSQSNGEVQFVRATTGTTSPQLVFKKSRGTTENPTPNSTGDDAGMIRFYSFVSLAAGNNYDEVARITVDTVGAPDAGAYRIYTAPTGGAPTERLYIGPTGLTGIGNATPSQALDVTGRIKMSTWTADGTVAVYYKATAGGAQNALGIQASDQRLKKDIEPLTNSLDKLKNINAYTYRMYDESSIEKKKLGVLAQEVKEVIPELTFNFKNEEGETYYGVYYDKLPVLLLEAIKEQQKIIEDLKARIEVLEAK